MAHLAKGGLCPGSPSETLCSETALASILSPPLPSPVPITMWKVGCWLVSGAWPYPFSLCSSSIRAEWTRPFL